MCGEITLKNGAKIFIDYEMPEWRWKWPPLDFTQFVDEPGVLTTVPPPPVPWREELTFLGAVLAGTSVIRDREDAAELGKLAADIGTRIAKRAEVDIKFAWDDHGGRQPRKSK
jgi:hypothetical protein